MIKHIFALLALFTLTACPATTPYATLNVSGMSCEACSTSVTNNLKKISGVTDVAVDVPSGNVYVYAPNDAQIDKKAIQEMVDKSGYKVESMTITKDQK